MPGVSVRLKLLYFARKGDLRRHSVVHSQSLSVLVWQRICGKMTLSVRGKLIICHQDHVICVLKIM